MNKALNKLFILIISLLLISGCSIQKNDTTYEVVTASDRIFTFEDLEFVGFKKNKEYDVTGLNGAIGALYGFWTTNKGQKEYELRFYPSHSLTSVTNPTFLSAVICNLLELFIANSNALDCTLTSLIAVIWLSRSSSIVAP